MALHPIFIFLGGLVIIVSGSEMLLRGASRVAAMLNISPIIIGLTIVSVGTSTPELAVGITAAIEGKGPLAVGNIAGTNIVNILLILGLSALIRPLPIRLQSIRLDVPFMIFSALLLIWMSLDDRLSRVEGVWLLGAAVIYTLALMRVSKREGAAMQREFSEEFGGKALRAGHGWRKAPWNSLMLLAGIAITVLGAELLVVGAVDIAKAYGVSDAFIGLTIVAIGTSAPELATTLLATIKNDRDVAIGNLIGSSIYNILVILGLTIMVSPRPVNVSESILRYDLPLAAAVALACLPIFRSQNQVSRLEGGIFVTAYAVYLALLVMFRG